MSNSGSGTDSPGSEDGTGADIVFTPTIRALQARNGSRDAYAKMEGRGGWSDEITPQLAQFIAMQNSFYLATSNAAGQPYIQHRGGPRGFLKVLDQHTLGMADFRGNRQFISQGNLLDNPRAFIFLMDYAHRRRIKIWGRAQMVEGDPILLERLMSGVGAEGYAQGHKAIPERALLFTVTAWDPNCPQHIPRKFDHDEVEALLEEKNREIARLASELARLRTTDTADGT